jgi:hypothetical protein
MIDTYTKAVLTVIALALVLLTVENLTYQARAQQAACGDYIHPCVVTTENPAESPHVVTSMLERQAMTAIERMTKDIKDINRRDARQPLTALTAENAVFRTPVRPGRNGASHLSGAPLRRHS